MSETGDNQRMTRLMRVIAERLEAYAEGDDLAFDTLGAALEDHGFDPEEVQAAAWMLRGTPDPAASEHSPADAPGQHAQRILSSEERAALSPAAWGYLLDLRRRGSLDASQMERVLDLLADCEIRPVDVETARETATRVALLEGSPAAGELTHGDIDVVH